MFNLRSLLVGFAASLTRSQPATFYVSGPSRAERKLGNINAAVTPARGQPAHSCGAGCGMSSHTPGPWYVGAQNDSLYVIDRRPAPSNDNPNHDADCELVATPHEARGALAADDRGAA